MTHRPDRVAHVYRPDGKLFVAMGVATPSTRALTEAAWPGSFVSPHYLGQRVTRTELQQFRAVPC